VKNTSPSLSKSPKMSENAAPELAKEAVLVESEKLPNDTPIVTGYDWNKGRNYEDLFKTFVHAGFQATNLGKAIEEVNKMVSKLCTYLTRIYE
jgi:deoxyhypusine synthase